MSLLTLMIILCIFFFEHGLDVLSYVIAGCKYDILAVSSIPLRGEPIGYLALCLAMTLSTTPRDITVRRFNC